MVNLGLDPWQALAMGLEVENLDLPERRRPVAEYARAAGWEGWLQDHRIELNAMRPAEFIAWLDEQLAGYAGKLVPPGEVLRARLAKQLAEHLREALTEEALRRARIDERVEETLGRIALPTESEVISGVKEWLGVRPKHRWTLPVDTAAGKLAAGAIKDRQ